MQPIIERARRIEAELIELERDARVAAPKSPVAASIRAALAALAEAQAAAFRLWGEETHYDPESRSSSP